MVLVPTLETGVHPPLTDQLEDGIHSYSHNVKDLLGKETDLELPRDVHAPALDKFSSLSNPGNDLSSNVAASTPENRQTGRDVSHIAWTGEDLLYLVGILFPDLVVTNQLCFAPSLEQISNIRGNVHLSLYARTNQVVPATAYCRNLPIGTGRYASYDLLAISGSCTSGPKARQALAKALLGDVASIHALCAKYQVMSMLYLQPDKQLKSLLRGMQLMANIRDSEHFGRIWQLRDVDHECEMEARLEAYLLGPGHEELGSWIACAECGVNLDASVRRAWELVYGNAAAFLARAARC